MKESESEMKNWIQSLIEEELSIYKESVLGKIAVANGSYTYGDDYNDENKDENCPSTSSIVQTVQQELQKYGQDGIGKIDQAQGAKIVHKRTSETYTPSTTTTTRRNSLGYVWWNKYIPEDWERYLLPKNWELWDVSIPSFVYHSLGVLTGDVAPPEAIVQKNVLPGSCWPMKGSNGDVTLKLINPIVVGSVTVDHVSSIIVENGKSYSAPKRIKVVGYPPCDDDYDDCPAVGFDINDPVDIAEINYDLDGPIVQTFDSHYTKAIYNLSSSPSLPESENFSSLSDLSFGVTNYDVDYDSVNDDSSSSCSQQTSCSVPPRIKVAAVTFRILENWGNPDFTCLYRFRVHSES